jgi:hypothetical protein
MLETPNRTEHFMDETTPENETTDDAVSEEVETENLIEAEERAAREDFTLADLFGGPERPKALPEKKRLIFRDLEAVAAYNEAHAAAKRLRDMFEAAPRIKRNDTAEKKAVYREMDAQVKAAEAIAEDKRVEMLKSALSFHMRAYPNIALKVARKEAQKLFTDPETGLFREGFTQEDSQEWMNLRLFGDSVKKVVRSDGREVSFGVPKSQLGELLSNSQNLHPASWMLLQQDFEELNFRAAVRQAAVEDPGF